MKTKKRFVGGLIALLFVFGLSVSARASTEVATDQSLQFNATVPALPPADLIGLSIWMHYQVMSPQLINESVRGKIGADNDTLIMGLCATPTIGTGTGLSIRLLFRAVGPSIKSFGLPNAADHPELTIYDSKGSVVARNAGWNNAPEIVQAGNQVGAFPLAANSTDAAILINLPAGTYTAMVRSPGEIGRDILIEAYDVSRDNLLHLSNFSGRSGYGPLILGCVADGKGAKPMLFRAVGAGLKPFGVNPVVENTMLTVFNNAGAQLTVNDDWGSNPSLSQTFASAGAFPIASTDAAVVYTMGVNEQTLVTLKAQDATTNAATTGRGMLVEAYELP